MNKIFGALILIWLVAPVHADCPIPAKTLYSHAPVKHALFTPRHIPVHHAPPVAAYHAPKTTCGATAALTRPHIHHAPPISEFDDFATMLSCYDIIPSPEYIVLDDLRPISEIPNADNLWNQPLDNLEGVRKRGCSGGGHAGFGYFPESPHPATRWPAARWPAPIPPAVPEPSTWLMMLIGFAVIGFRRWYGRHLRHIDQNGTINTV